jgi:60 kDa SS-A/Ro ribonucleoprotein
MALDLTKYFNLKKTPQNQPIPGAKQVLNSAGGYSFAVDCWARLDRFLILGSEGGSYYASERELSLENASAVAECIDKDGVRVVDRVVEISDAGRAPKNDPAIFALAMCAKLGDDKTRKAALAALPLICRIGTHLFHFARDLEAFGGWGRGTRRAVAKWYTEMPAEKLAHQAVKYQARDGWSHRDMLRLAHPKAGEDAVKNALFGWIVKGELAAGVPQDGALSIVRAFEEAKGAKTTKAIIDLIRQHELPREAIPTEWLNEADVWAALLDKMPMTAMIRNLATMTRVGLLSPLNGASSRVTTMLRDKDALKKARIHPIAVLAALMTYKAGHGARGHHEWKPISKIVDALDAAFYAAFTNVEPTSKRWLLALDVSGSMTCGEVAGVPGLTPRVASAAMALVTAATEEKHAFVAFTCGGWASGGGKNAHGVSGLDISPRMRLDSALEKVTNLSFGGTDCALPMLYAMDKRLDVDVFVVLTDSETWAGSVHPVQALVAYREKRGIPAKLIVVGMVSNGFSIADPNDAGMMDVVGFDTSVPQLMSDFAKA